MKLRLFPVCIVYIVWAFSLHAQSADSKEITLLELKDHMSVLTSDSLQGRKSGTSGGRKAAQYIADVFNQSDLELIFENGYQPFDVVSSVKAGENNRCEFGSFQGIIHKDFNPLSFSKNSSFQGPVAFMGYGFEIETDDLSWHDYQGMDLNGKWALILQGHPDEPELNTIFREHASLRKKAIVAKDHGAGGILFVSGKLFDEKDVLNDIYYNKSQGHLGIPVLHIKRSIADQLLARSGKQIENLEKTLNQTMTPVRFFVEEIVTGETDLFKEKTRTQNVVSILRGNDSKLSEEFIVLGAHYDHLGLGGPGSGSRKPDTTAVHNGADDNASGVVSMLEISEKLAAHRNQLKRSVLFVAFGAEEMGTIGSRFFTENPPVPVTSIKAMINLDMVGRLDDESRTLSLGGTGTAENFKEYLTEHLDVHDLKANCSPEGYGPSDHAAFYSHDIPVLSVMTGIHQDYHTPEDDIEKINFVGQKEVSDFIYSLIFDLASRESNLIYKEAGPKEQANTGRKFKVTLGIMPDVAAGDVIGLRVSAVIPNRPAYKAGIEKGDVIVAIEGRKVGDIYEYMHRLSELKAGQRISVEIVRNSDTRILIVEL